jgi:hypothetical protein
LPENLYLCGGLLENLFKNMVIGQI